MSPADYRAKRLYHQVEALAEVDSDHLKERIMAAHYHVLTGMFGYIPNMNYYADTKKGALSLARSEARDYRDAGYRVKGSAENGYIWGHSDADDPGSILGYFGYIEVGAKCADCCDPEANY